MTDSASNDSRRASGDDPQHRYRHMAGGAVLALAGAALFISLFFGLREWIRDLEFGVPVLFAVRAVAFTAIGWGSWHAYRHYRRL